jgi:hypothetical protein
MTHLKSEEPVFKSVCCTGSDLQVRGSPAARGHGTGTAGLATTDADR